MVYSAKWSSYTVLLVSTRPYGGAWRRSCAAASMIAAPCVAASIVEHVSKNPVCHAPVVVRVEAELLHARPTVVLGKPHLNIVSHLAGGRYVSKCQLSGKKFHKFEHVSQKYHNYLPLGPWNC